MSLALKVGKLVGQLSTAAFVASFVVPNFIYTVPPGHRAVIFDRFSGVQNKTHGPGLNFKLPWVHIPHILDARTTPTDIPTSTGAKDLQQVQVSLRLLSRPDQNRLPQIFNDLGLNYNDKILPSLSNEVLKAVVAQYNAEQLITLRDSVSREVREALSARCEQFGILLDDVSLTHVGFSPDFAKAIEEKQVAEQTAERAKYVVTRAEQERQAAIIRAEGDAIAAKLVSDALEKAGPGLIELRRLETALAVVTSLANKSDVTYLPGESNAMLMIPAAQRRQQNDKKSV